ncbi:MAG: DUF4301 family protein [Bacteroidales bacterium]|nr:DUF4301 family protein [Bacteroidales bacterium]MDD2425426.1 DUF4301 family protein [Bacteroidales bacterium]MDD3988881.1 DUF4301 family protein [Bacteroidales bacterium]MDD4638430.1 DUF4301 family protein [Bacteroidales bacterium]
MLTIKDIKDIEERGQSVESVLKDIETLKKGFPALEIRRAATPGKGIKILSDADIKELTEICEQYEGTICRFIPASGAATRMFKEILNELTLAGREDPENIKGDSSDFPTLRKLRDSIGKFAFCDDIYSFPAFERENPVSCAIHMLTARGLNYASLPKGLIKFHRYAHETRTPLEEQLVEGALSCKDKRGISKILFTVSPEHREKFEKLFNDVKDRYQSSLNVTFDIGFTLQKSSTDKIAVDMEDKPFRKEDGRLLFRPAGHGALLENLGDIPQDIVVIKNIDNVVHQNYLEETIKWKKILIGALIDLKNKIFSYLHKLEKDDDPDLNREIIQFMESELSITIPSLPEPLVKSYLKEKLNRPVRVCGMVRNTGEPGGGPFIVMDPDGALSPQILEGVQFDISDPDVAAVVEKSTHFNPVDIVCYLKNYRGEKFDLHKYTDPETGFISIKSQNGKEVKALELPGLWNGSMSQWNTLFVEVPLITFNPVKTVFDLLRKEHAG